MKTLIKHFAVMASVSLVVYILGCKKDVGNSSNTVNNISTKDFRDSLTGSYNCILHKVSYSSSIYHVSTDTIIGSNMLSVSKSLTDSGLIINGIHYPIILYQDSLAIAFVTQNTDINSTAMLFNFSYTTDSIFLDSNSTLGSEAFREGGMLEYRGRKN